MFWGEGLGEGNGSEERKACWGEAFEEAEAGCRNCVLELGLEGCWGRVMLEVFGWFVLSLERAPREEMERRRVAVLNCELCLGFLRGG